MGEVRSDTALLVPVTEEGNRLREYNETRALAVVFGGTSVPWTYAFAAVTCRCGLRSSPL